MTGPMTTPTGPDDELDLRKCPSCGVRELRCFMREAEIGSHCCGDCLAHNGQHQWPAIDIPNPTSEVI